MKIACVRVPHFALRVALLDRPQLDGAPLALVTAEGISTIVECTPEAAARGVRPGMYPREVVTLCPNIILISPNPIRDEAVFGRIVDRLEALSPLVEPSEPGCCYVDLQGLERHFNGLEDVARHLCQTAPSVFRPRVGIASTKFAAWVAAGRARPGGMLRVDPADVRGFLGKEPIVRLPIPRFMLRQMEQLGFRTMGDLAALPSSAVAARFGPVGLRAWTLANGQDETRLIPRNQEETVSETLTLPSPVAGRETLLIALRQLVGRTFDQPVLRSRHVRQVRLRVMLEERRSWERTMTLREPAGRDRLIEILMQRLQTLTLPGATEELTLELTGLTAESAWQEMLAEFRPRRSRPLVEAARQLKQRYGASPLYRITEVEPWSRIPERRHALIRYDP